MTDKHPITPPRELVKEWIAEIWHEGTPVQVAQSDLHLANHAAQWGYDQRGEVNEAKLQEARDEELEACCEWLGTQWLGARTEGFPAELRDARRPKPPTQAEQAMQATLHLQDAAAHSMDATESADIIRRALERLKQLEDSND